MTLLVSATPINAPGSFVMVVMALVELAESSTITGGVSRELVVELVDAW
jgi:hypothetical protein